MNFGWSWGYLLNLDHSLFVFFINKITKKFSEQNFMSKHWFIFELTFDLHMISINPQPIWTKPKFSFKSIANTIFCFADLWLQSMQHWLFPIDWTIVLSIFKLEIVDLTLNLEWAYLRESLLVTDTHFKISHFLLKKKIKRIQKYMLLSNRYLLVDFSKATRLYCRSNKNLMLFWKTVSCIEY